MERVVGRYVRAFAPERIVLFGSTVKGMRSAGSDVDLLVVSDNGAARRDVDRRRARQLAADCFPRVDVVFATPEEIVAADSAPSPFLASILGTGVVVYERGSSIVPRVHRSEEAAR